MAFDLPAALPFLIPQAIAWAEAQSALIAQSGQPLSEGLLALASGVGVLHPELIRLAEVPSIPLPDTLELRQAALNIGLLGTNTAGLTLVYGIYVCRGQGSARLLSHEFRHVQQYGQAGSPAAYLDQFLTVGYRATPFEVDARSHGIKR